MMGLYGDEDVVNVDLRVVKGVVVKAACRRALVGLRLVVGDGVGVWDGLGKPPVTVPMTQ
jgi:hypothetical protein